MGNIEQNYEDFISTVSHELRTPLTSIRGFAQTMLSSWDKLDDVNKKKFIKIIEEQSNRLTHLVENMLAVTKLNTNSNIVYSQINIFPLIEQTAAIVKTQYPNHNFSFNFGKNIPNIFADKDKLQQVLTNLFENSAKYSYESNQTEVKSYVKENKVFIEVSNTGIDLTKEDCEKIFTKFSRIDNPLTRKVQGSGLGLYITRKLTQQMGGNISVKSEKFDGNSNLAKITFALSFDIKTIEEEARIKCNL